MNERLKIHEAHPSQKRQQLHVSFVGPLGYVPETYHTTTFVPEASVHQHFRLTYEVWGLRRDPVFVCQPCPSWRFSWNQCGPSYRSKYMYCGVEVVRATRVFYEQYRRHLSLKQHRRQHPITLSAITTITSCCMAYSHLMATAASDFKLRSWRIPGYTHPNGRSRLDHCSLVEQQLHFVIIVPLTLSTRLLYRL